jgi:hypothetical protein
MSIPYPTAKKACTAVEFTLIDLSKPANLANLRPAVLKTKIAQARKYADKWRDLVRKQQAAKDGKAERSLEKQEWFTEVLTRYETKLAKVTAQEAAAKAPAKKVAPVKKAAPAKKAAPKPAAASRKKAAQKKAAKKKVAAKKATATKAPATKAAATKPPVKTGTRDLLALSREAKGIQKGRITAQVLDKSGLKSRVKGHVSAAGRRNQAARSARKGS